MSDAPVSTVQCVLDVILNVLAGVQLSGGNLQVFKYFVLIRFFLIYFSGFSSYFGLCLHFVLSVVQSLYNIGCGGDCY